MALATQCPHCQTRFRVASDQLKLRGGIVRCGSCQRIFDGSAHLIELDAPPATPAVPSSPSSSTDAPAPSADASMAPSELPLDEPAHEAADGLAAPVQADADPVQALDVDSKVDPPGILPEADGVAHDAVADEAAHEIAHEINSAPQDPEPPHGDALAHALETSIDDAPVEPAESAESAESVEPAMRDEVPPSFAPQARIEPSFDLPVDEELVAQPLPDHAADMAPDVAADSAPAPAVAPSVAAPGDAHSAEAARAEDHPPPAALPLRASAGGEPGPASMPPPPRSARAKAVEARARRTRLTPTRIDAPKLRVPETDEPEFVKRSRKQEQAGRMRRILMMAGAVLLLLLLLAQLVLNFRNVMAARHPGARPVLGAACALLGCRVELPTQIDNLAIEDGELTTLGPDTYSLNTLLRNQGSLVQAWPSIELELTDANNKAVLRRVFTPAEYLQQGVPQGVPAAAGFGARSEQPVKLHFALADLKPSGYHIFIFYP
jgi:predicted Zn finger-like uncharacterized protein